jgi:two-component system, cell cycle sensor histidine kinase and response regulator CckA
VGNADLRLNFTLESIIKSDFKNMNLQTSSKELILIVDDDSLVRDTLENSLTAHNYNSLVASDGIEAIALYARHRFDISVVLIDLMMVSLDGATTIRVLKAINSQVAVVAMSGLPCYDIAHFLNGINVNDFLLKPFTIQELLQVLQAISCPKIR